jgi:hypothetical protein
MRRAWTIEKTGKGVSLVSGRPSAFQDTVILDIGTADIPKWRLGLRNVLHRLSAGHSHRLRVTLPLRLMLGHWRPHPHNLNYYGGVPSRSCHIVAVGDTLHLLVRLYSWAAYPISRHDLEHIKALLD